MSTQNENANEAGGGETQTTNISYVNGIDGTDGNINAPQYTTADADCETLQSSENATTLSAKWYVAEGEVTINGDVTLGGDTHIILADDATMTVSGSIVIPGGSKLYIYGQEEGAENSDKSGEMTVTATNGSAFKKGTGDDSASIYFYGGEIKAKGITSAIEDGISLYNCDREAGQIMPMACYTDDLTKPIEHNLWCGKSNLAANEVSFSSCICMENFADLDPNVWNLNKVSDRTHKRICKFCDYKYGGGMDSAEEEACTFDGLTNGYNITAEGHAAKCACGNVSTIRTPHDNEATVLTEGNKQHSLGCSECEYASGTPEGHDYNDYGTCNVCQFMPIMSDSEGNLYDNYKEAFAAVVEGNAEYVQLESYVEGGVVSTAIEFDYPGESVKLKMNDKTLSALGSAALEVSSGKLIIEGKANISVPNNTQIAPAIKVTGGTLSFTNNLTVTGGLGGGKQSSAIEVTGGTLTCNGAVNATVPFNDRTSDQDPITAPAIRVTNGTLTFEKDLTAKGGAAYYKQSPAIEVAGGTVTFKGTVNAIVCDETDDKETMIAVADKANLAPAIKVMGGEATFAEMLTAVGGKHSMNGNFSTRAAAVYADAGELDFNGDLDLNGGLTLINDASLTKKLTQGKFYNDCMQGSTINITDNTTYGKNVMKLLKDGYTFKKISEDETNNKFYYNTSNPDVAINLIIEEHKHDYKREEGNSSFHLCECGARESHEYGNDGKCKICSYACQHPTVWPQDEYECGTCHQHMLVQIKDANNSTTYSTDLVEALNGAGNGQTVILLKDAELLSSPEIYDENKQNESHQITLDLNGHNITGEFAVSIGRHVEFVPAPVYVENTEYPTTLKIIGSGDISLDKYALSVYPLATLDLSEWKGDSISMVSTNDGTGENEEGQFIATNYTGHINRLELGYGNKDAITKSKLSRGSYGEIVLLGACGEKFKHGDLLEDGYAFQHTDGTFAEYNAIPEQHKIFNVQVVKCQHAGMEPNAETGFAKCAYCNAEGSFVASVDGDLYTADEWDKAFKAWLDDGGTLKLYTDYNASGDVVWNGGYGSNVLDLNGHVMSADNGAFKPADPLVAGMSLTIRDTSNDQNGSISHIILSRENNYNSLTLESGHIGNLEVVDTSGTVTLEGGSLGAYSLPEGRILMDVLGYQCYATGTSLEKSADTAQDGKKFVIEKAPYEFGSTSKTADVSVNGSIPFTVDSPDSDKVGVYNVKWFYRTDSGVVAMPEGKVTGVDVNETLNVFCVITGLDQPNNGTALWQVAVENYTIKVVPANLSGDDTKIVIENKDSYVYNGNAITPNVKVRYNGTELTEGEDYTITENASGTAAGTYNLTITGKGNYAGTATTKWEIKPATLTIAGATAKEKEYDGKTDATIADVSFTGLVNNEKLTANDYTITANYVDATASRLDDVDSTYVDKEINGTVTLKDTGIAKNYVLADDGRFTTKGKITKASVSPSRLETNLEVVNNYEARYMVALPALPELPDGCEYGDTLRSITGVNLRDYCTEGGAGFILNADTVFLDINKVDTETEGEIGTVTVTVSTTNYQDITLTINVSAVNKKVPVPEGDLTLKGKLTYGESLDIIKISGTMKDAETSQTVSGTFTWANPDEKLNAGDHKVVWKFTPDDKDKYAEATGEVAITVEKAVPTGKPAYTPITEENHTLAEAALGVKDANGDDAFSVPGTVKWIDADGIALDGATPVKRGESYKWIFTPTDSANYETITGTIVLWAKPSSGGGSSITTPSSDVKTDDKAGTTDEKVTTSPAEVKNETKTDASGNQVTTATVTISAANQKEILKQAEANKSGEIIIKVSKDSVKDGAKLELSLDKSFIEDILNKTDADLTIQTPDGEKTFTQEELKRLVESTSGNTVTLDPAAGTTDPTDPTTPSTDKNAKLIKGIQNTTIVLKSKLTKSGKIRLTWTKSKGYKVDRFEIYRSVKKNSGYGKKAFFTTKSGSTAKYLNTKSLKKGKTYYYKLRGVRTIGGKKYYTQWSNKTWKTVK